MTTKLIPLLLLSLLAAGANAQCTRDYEEEVERTIAAQKAAAQAKADADAATDKKLQAALNTTLVAMNDGVEQGGVVAYYMESKKIAVEFGDLLDLSAQQPGKIGLSRKIAAYPRAIGPRLAWEVAAMQLADMPDSAEKEYMRRSVAARVFLELGGDASKLPVVETLANSGMPKDEVLSKEMKLWLDNKNSEMALYKIGEATKQKGLMEQIDAEKNAAKKAALEAANKRFTQFLIAENSWKQANPR